MSDTASIFVSPVDWALAYLALGYSVLPASAKKLPITSLAPRAVHSATNDPAIAMKWWADPRGLHADPAIAIDLSFVVADCDEHGVGQHGVADFTHLAGMPISAFADRVAAPWCTTANGGHHIYFRTDGRVYRTAYLKGTGIELRAAGHYCVAPGFRNGREWRRPLVPVVDLPPVPPWFDPLLKREPLMLVPREALPQPGKPGPGSSADAAGAADPLARRKALGLLERACALISAAEPGTRDNTRHAQCFLIGGLVGRGVVAYAEAYHAVLRAMAVHPPRHDLEARIARSIESGMAHPLPVSETEAWLHDLHERVMAQRAAQKAEELKTESWLSGLRARVIAQKAGR
jgi:hypothetical protein